MMVVFSVVIIVFTLIAFADEDTTGEEHKIAWYYCLTAGWLRCSAHSTDVAAENGLFVLLQMKDNRL